MRERKVLAVWKHKFLNWKTNHHKGFHCLQIMNLKINFVNERQYLMKTEKIQQKVRLSSIEH